MWPGAGSGTGAAVLQSIAATIAVGRTQQFTATGSYNDGSQQNVTPSAARNAFSIPVGKTRITA